MKSNHVALIVAIVVACAGAGVALRPNEHQKMLQAVAKLNAALPRQVDSVTTQTAVALDGQVIRNFYTVNQPIELDGALIVALEQAVRRQACAKAEVTTALAKGYSIDNVYAITTRHGPDKVDIPVTKADCH